jgi:hypothetical protein
MRVVRVIEQNLDGEVSVHIWMPLAEKGMIYVSATIQPSQPILCLSSAQRKETERMRM